MRTFIIAAFVLLAALPVAHAATEGSICDYTYAGFQDGIIQNGKCVSRPDSGGATTPSSNPSPTYNPSGSGISLINPLKGVNCANGNGNCLAAFLNSILDFIIQIGTILIVLMVVFVGYKFVVAQGAPAKIEEARKMLLWTLVGALILLGAKAISLGIVATVQALGG